VAHRVISLPRSNSAAFGAKPTWTLTDQNLWVHALNSARRVFGTVGAACLPTTIKYSCTHMRVIQSHLLHFSFSAPSLDRFKLSIAKRLPCSILS
jgi:hypothetical protein